MSRRLLQICIVIGGLIPVAAGCAGIFLGLVFVDATVGVGPDSHFRYLCGLLLGIGIAFWSTVPEIQAKGERFRVLTFIVFVGGLGRLLALIAQGPPPSIMSGALAMELGVTPLLCWWQWRVSKKAALL